MLTLNHQITGSNRLVGAAESGELLAHLLHAVTSVLNVFAKRREDLIDDGFNRLVHREHAIRLARSLFVAAVARDPFRNEPLLLFMECKLRGTILAIAFLLAPQIGTEAPMRLGRDILRKTLIGGDIL
jgi:hypothetical protein